MQTSTKVLRSLCAGVGFYPIFPSATEELGRGRLARNQFNIMKTLHKPALLALALAVVGALTGCNTMEGLGKDTEKVGEKIQDKAR